MSVSRGADLVYSFVTALFTFFLFQTIPHVYKDYVGHQFLSIVSNNDLYRNLFLLFGLLLVTFEHNLLPEIENNLLERVILAFFLFVFVLLFSRQEAIYNAIEIFIFFILYIIYKLKIDDYGVSDSAIEYATFALVSLAFLIIFVGYYQYMLLKMNQKGSRFTLTKFVFGKREKEYSS